MQIHLHTIESQTLLGTLSTDDEEVNENVRKQ